ncbi:hypothetical protein DFH09DRAFT_1366527 [Mycena vulgaris]|nr:hypothetical protein DFH09DRAFT_1366527 [Mycena vulgaris]
MGIPRPRQHLPSPTPTRPPHGHIHRAYASPPNHVAPSLRRRALPALHPASARRRLGRSPHRAPRRSTPFLAAARARYALKTSRPPPHGFDAFYAFAREHNCLIDAYDGVHADFVPFWQVERRGPGVVSEAVAERLKKDPRGMTALSIRDGEVHRPDYQGTYFDGDWERTINKFAAALPPRTVLINGRDEPRVMFDALPLFRASSPAASASTSDSDTEAYVNAPPPGAGGNAPPPPPSHSTSDNANSQGGTGGSGSRKGDGLHLTLTDPTPFAFAPPSTAAFFAPRAGCGPAAGVEVMAEVPFLLSASSAEFTTGLVPVLSMTKPADGAGVGGGSTAAEAGGVRGPTCFVDLVVPGEFKYADNVAWGDKKEVLYWRGKSNGGHIRETNYLFFPHFRLLDLTARPANREKGYFDVRMTGWHEEHCTTSVTRSRSRGGKISRGSGYRGTRYVVFLLSSSSLARSVLPPSSFRAVRK